jgi:hypothetical protein
MRTHLSGSHDGRPQVFEIQGPRLDLRGLSRR